MGISRRNFLTGIVAATAGSELIIKADAADVVQFSANRPVNVGEVQQLLANVQKRDYSSVISPARNGDVLYNKYGQPVGVVDKVWFFRRGSEKIYYTDEEVRQASQYWDSKEPLHIATRTELIWTDDFNQGVADGVDRAGLPDLLRRS